MYVNLPISTQSHHKSNRYLRCRMDTFADVSVYRNVELNLSQLESVQVPLKCTNLPE